MPCRVLSPKDGPLGAMMAAMLKSVAFPLSPFVGIPSRAHDATLIRTRSVSYYSDLLTSIDLMLPVLIVCLG